MPVAKARVQALPLNRLATAEITQQSTLYVPPIAPPKPCPKRLALVAAHAS
jgi:hypothetical protein